MQLDEPQARIGYRDTAVSRFKLLAAKTLVVVGGVVTLASAFVLSLVFVAIGFVVVASVGGYLWWKTRELRRQVRARMQESAPPRYADSDVIEGEVISPESARILREPVRR